MPFNDAVSPVAPALEAEGGQLTDAMARLYDHYYASHAYDDRYPRPNPGVMRFLLEHGAASARHVLDFGCGSGRYGMALLEHGAKRMTAYDISKGSLSEYARRLHHSPHAARVTLVGGESSTPAALSGAAGCDMVLMLFGVLSHVGARAERLQVLQRLRRLIADDGSMILSVPSIWRRRPLELARAALGRRIGSTAAPLDEAGNIRFRRHVGGKPVEFFYHLYSLRRLRDELAQAGFKLSECRPESVLPEWLVTQYPRLAQLDAAIAPLLPAALGYGICALARPA